MAHYKVSRILKESFPLLTLCILLEVMAGQLLEANMASFSKVPILLAVIPVINGVGGNIGSILGSRMTSGMHLGSMKASFTDKNLLKNIGYSLLMGAVAYTSLCMILWSLHTVYGSDIGIGFLELAAIMIGAGILMVVSLSVIAVFTASRSFRRGVDPDNVVTPSVTTSGDLLGINFMLLMVVIVL